MKVYVLILTAENSGEKNQLSLEVEHSGKMR